MCAVSRCFSVMSVGLAVLGLVYGITIDNHLITSKNDCYERLALGQRLDPRDVTRSLALRTAHECQVACSAEDQNCLSLSFGISPKGNGTCELSYAPIRETADLKPIGTIRDPDFDLYIKKVDCKLNIPKDPPASDVVKPTYAVSVQDRPSSQGYEVQEPSPNPPIRRPIQRPPDVLVFHGERPGGHYSYQNYYDVPRPLPMPYGPNQPYFPVSDYSQDNQYYHMPRPGWGSDGYRPNYYSDYYGQVQPNRPYKKPYEQNYYGNEKPVNDERPYYGNADKNSPVRPQNYGNDKPVNDDRPYYGNADQNGPVRPQNYGYEKPLNDERPYYGNVDTNGPVRPLNYGNDKPVNDERPYYGNVDKNNPVRPQNYGNEKPVNEERPYYENADKNSPIRPQVFNPDNPNIYDDRPLSNEQLYGAEPNRNSYVSSQQNTRPITYDPNLNINKKPYKEQYPGANNYPVKDPVTINYEPDIKPQRPPYDNRPYGPDRFDNRPYNPDRYDDRPYNSDRYGNRPYGSDHYDNRPRPDRFDNRPYGQEQVNNRPYNPDNRPYGSNYGNKPSSFDDNRIYGDNHDIKRPYGSYVPENNHYYNKPSSLQPNIDKLYDSIKPYPKPLEDPYNSDKNKDKQDSSNPNNYGNKGDWDRVGTGSGTLKPVKRPEQSQGQYGASPQGPDRPTIQPKPQEGTVTSGITQIIEPCYRRALAGKRIARSFIMRAVPCERVEDCQRECQEEKRFVCEGFNYRLDESGRGQGDCELTDLPLSRLDPGRDIIIERDYDFYEKDRNSGPNCKPFLPPLRPPLHGGPPLGPGGSPYGPGRPSYGPGGPSYGPGGPSYGPGRPSHGPSGPPHGPIGPPHGPYGHGGPSYGSGGPPWHQYPSGPPPPHRPALPPPPHRPALPPPPHHPPMPPSGSPYLGDRRKDDGYYHGYYYYSDSDRNRYNYNSGNNYPMSRPHYPLPPSGRPPYGSHPNREWDRGSWGLPMYGHGYGHSATHGQDWNRSHFVPYRIGQVGGSQDWGRYGGSYGGGYAQNDAFNYWGFGHRDHHDNRRVHHLPAPPSHGPPAGPGPQGHYLPVPHHYEPSPHRHEPPPYLHEPPPYLHEPPPHHHEPPPRRPPVLPHYPPPGHGHTNHIGYDDLPPGTPYPRKDDCSTRSGMGFRLHKGVVKKYYAVPNIHECEMLCYREKDFICVSFSFRYSITLSSPTDNCYLSDRPYKDLDFYTELEPDRDFDIYTMHRTQSCLIPVVEEESECFLRVRSGQRLDSSVVKDTLNAKTIVECQLECLTATRFTCRSFSYRWGPSHYGGAIDSCQLSDWPFAELDPRRDLMPEPGYEVYERGSYGHGCEHNHFDVAGHHGHLGPGQHIGDGSAIPKFSDKVCYVGYAKPARLTPEAAKGALSVSSELDCKAECTRAREQSAFQCMSFSFRNTPMHNQPNCELSDVEQRDLRPELDYRRDPDAWLFAWDSLSSQCLALLDQEHGGHKHDHVHNPQDTWSVYSVSGWPCRRGTTCQENREAGFWSCELEGGEVGSWDYCCRPDHHCGYSQGYNYQWCYVGPSRDQWRTCSEQYFPYQEHQHHRQPGGPYLPRPPTSGVPGHNKWHAERPYRPPYGHPAPGPSPAHRPSLDEYEDKFHHQFLEPPRPGGLGRHWPVSYLHKETPPNATAVSNTTSSTTAAPDDRQNRKMDSAIDNVVHAIQAADLNNTRYHAANQSDGADDVLFVRLPMPTSSARLTDDDAHTPKFDVVDTKPQAQNQSKGGFDELFLISPNSTSTKRESTVFPGSAPVVRRGTVTRTNRTARRRRLRPKNELVPFLN